MNKNQAPMTSRLSHRQRVRFVACVIVLAVIGIVAWSWWEADPDPTLGSSSRATTSSGADHDVSTATPRAAATNGVPTLELIATADGVPLSGVGVRVGGSESSLVLTNSSGVAEIRSLPEDRVVTLEASHPRWGSATREVLPGDRGPVIVAFESDSMVRVCLHFLGLVSLAEIGIVDAKGVTVAERRYEKRGTGDRLYEATFYPLPAGRYSVRATGREGDVVVEDEFEIARNGEFVDLVLKHAGVRDGVAPEARFVNGVALLDGVPLSSQFLRVKAAGVGESMILTDDDGGFEVHYGVPDGTILTFEIVDPVTESEPFRTPPRDALRVTFHSSVRSRLRVSGANGVPVVGAWVRVRSGGLSLANLPTDEEGSISLDGVPPGEYEVTVAVADVESDGGTTEFGPYRVSSRGHDVELRIERAVTCLVAEFDGPVQPTTAPVLGVIHEGPEGRASRKLQGRLPTSVVLPTSGHLWAVGYLEDSPFDSNGALVEGREFPFVLADRIACASAPSVWKLRVPEVDPVETFEVRLPDGQPVTDAHLHADSFTAGQVEADLLALLPASSFEHQGGGVYSLARIRGFMPDRVWIVSAHGACPVDLRLRLPGRITLDPQAALTIHHDWGLGEGLMVVCESGRRIPVFIPRQLHVETAHGVYWLAGTFVATHVPLPDGEVPLEVLVTTSSGEERVVPVTNSVADLTEL